MKLIIYGETISIIKCGSINLIQLIHDKSNELAILNIYIYINIK